MKREPIRRILLVEDDCLVAAGTRAELEREAVHTTVAHTSADALHSLDEGLKVEFALLDYGLPDQSGATLGRTLLERYRLPFAFLTGRSDTDTVRDAAASGAVGFVLKPATAREMLAVVETGLARAAELMALSEHARQLVEGRRAANIANGIVMERYGLSEEESIRVVRYFARSNRMPLEEAARRIVDRRGSLELLSAMGRMLERT